MKRTELTVGAELYYARPYEWKNDRTGDRVVVVATEPHRQRDWIITEVPIGNGVLVNNPGKPERTVVVPLGHLRGPYAEIKAEVEARAAERRKLRAEEEERRDRRRDAAISIARRARDAGYATWLDQTPGQDLMIRLTPETLDRLLTAAEKGWGS